MAFYSDAGGEAGLWIWELDGRTVRRFLGIAVRPFFGFEKARFSPDGGWVLAKVVPSGRTVREMNALGVQPSSGALRSPVAEPGKASVLVRTAGLPEAKKLQRRNSDSRTIG